MIKSRLTAKFQTVLPQAVRQHLGIGPGNEIVYEITKAGEVVLRAAEVQRNEDPFHLFDEWASPGDEDAYADLPVAKTGS